MSRDLRFLHRPGAMVEITQRTIQGRFLFRPSPRLNAIVVGCLARAQKSTAARVHAVAVMSNHLHLLASFASVEQMSRFMCHLKTNLSKEVGRLHDWQGPMFAGRYRSIPVSDEPEAQLARLEYLLSQGAKEGLVLSPKDWPGVHSVAALAESRPLRGIWIDRTAHFAARQKDRDAAEADFTSEELLELTPLPCWSHLPPIERQRRVVEMIAAIEARARAEHKAAGTEPSGARAVLRRHPFERPKQLVKSIGPRFHAASTAVRTMLIEAYREFVIAYRQAAAMLAGGDRRAVFPENCFPPRLPFVHAAAA